MAELVASIATQMRYDLLSEQGLSSRMVEEVTAEVKKLVSILFRIEKLLRNENGEDERILKNTGTIKHLYYRIEDALEECAVEVAAAIQRDKKDEHEATCVKRLVRKWSGSSLDIIARKTIKGKIKDLQHDTEQFLADFPDHDQNNQQEEQVEEEDHNSGSRQRPFNKEAEATIVNRSPQNTRTRWPRRGYPVGTQEYFVGRNHDLSELKKFIMEENEHRVISIWGKQGMGKTAIVRKIYNDPQVRKHFKAFAWVSPKNEAPMETVTVLKDILRQLGPSQKVAETAEDLAEQLKEIWGHKNCLIVLDRIELIDMWTQIRPYLGFNRKVDEGRSTENLPTTSVGQSTEILPTTGVGESTEILPTTRVGESTKFLLTTREEEVARVDEVPYELKPLDQDEGWELLKKHAFPVKAVTATPDLGLFPKLGKEMVSKCGNLPSAISILGRKLIDKTSLNDWHTVNNDIAQYLQNDHHIEADEGLSSQLASTYDNLPYNLRQCFLYLGGVFCQNESIDAQDLMFLWMAEGMVSSLDQSREGAMIFTARNYLRELAEKGMLEVRQDEFSGNRRFNLCYLHQRVRELSLYQGEKEDFHLNVVDFCDGNRSVLDSLATLNDETRRLVMHFSEISKLSMQDRDAMKEKVDGMTHIRSLLFLNHGKWCTDLPVTFDFKKFILLRVVHFVRCKFEGRSLPKGIDKLINLRYLGLFYCDLKELPHDIVKLRNLNVLNLRAYDTAQITLPPDVLLQMVLLKHLSLPHYSYSEQTKKLSLDNLKELETLIGFNNLIHDLSSLRGLDKLRRLEAHAYTNDCVVSIIKFVGDYGARIRTNLCIENRCDFTSAEGLAILEETLMCMNLYELTLSMVFIHKFPDCGTYVSSELTQLKLIGCKIKEDPMETLGKFPKLQKLCLGYGAFVGTKMIVHKGGFRNLDDLELQSLPNLKECEVHKEAMPKLSGLVIHRCPNMERIPCGLENVKTLKSMDIELTPNGLADGKEETYRKSFEFVNSFRIRKLDSLL